MGAAKSVTRRKDNNVPFVIKWRQPKLLIGAIGPHQDCHVDGARLQLRDQFIRRRLGHSQLDAIVPPFKFSQEARESDMPDRVMNAELERHLRQKAEVFCQGARGFGLVRDRLKVRKHRSTRPRQADFPALPFEQGRAQLRLKRLDPFGQRRLRNAAILGRAGEIQILRG